MQRHSGEHVLSGIVHSRYGYNNVGFHMSEIEMTVDFDGVLSQTDIEMIEKEVNFTLWKNLDITVSFPAPEEEEKLSYRSKLENIRNLRLVTIDGVDCCACCAPHVAKTGEIGLVKIIDSTPNKGGTRLTVRAGEVALSDYARLNSANKTMMKTLSVAREDIADAAKRQVDLVGALKHENEELKCRLAWSELEVRKVSGIAVAFCKNSSYEELRYCSNKLAEEGSEFNFLFSTDDDKNYIYVVSSTSYDVRPVVKELNEAFDGRGGGKPNYAQGKIVCDSIEEIENFVKEILG
jgi:alanyl-tRNA synthetase